VGVCWGPEIWGRSGPARWVGAWLIVKNTPLLLMGDWLALVAVGQRRPTAEKNVPLTSRLSRSLNVIESDADRLGYRFRHNKRFREIRSKNAKSCN